CKHQTHTEEGEEPRTDRADREGVHRRHDTAADYERAENDQQEGEDDQPEVPCAQPPSPLLDLRRVEAGGGGQPGQESNVLNWIPAPVATPAEDVVGPPLAEHEARALKAPGDQ